MSVHIRVERWHKVCICPLTDWKQSSAALTLCQAVSVYTACKATDEVPTLPEYLAIRRLLPPRGVFTTQDMCKTLLSNPGNSPGRETMSTVTECSDSKKKICAHSGQSSIVFLSKGCSVAKCLDEAHAPQCIIDLASFVLLQVTSSESKLRNQMVNSTLPLPRVCFTGEQHTIS